MSFPLWPDEELLNAGFSILHRGLWAMPPPLGDGLGWDHSLFGYGFDDSRGDVIEKWAGGLHYAAVQ
jgi:hypothetical protein